MLTIQQVASLNIPPSELEHSGQLVPEKRKEKSTGTIKDYGRITSENKN